ncbi:MAG: hypothetical protein ABW194_03695 [Novosphingobium sp.]
MTRPHVFLAAVGLPATALMALQPGESHARQPVSLTYYLPRTVVSATVTQRLVRCEGSEVDVATDWKLASETAADYSQPVRVDASSGFLAKRSVDLTLNPDGTLSAFNSESEGQRAAVIQSVLKLAGTLAPIVASGGVLASPRPQAAINPSLLPPRPPTCTQQAVRRLRTLAQLNERIARIEDTVAAGEAAPGQENLLELLRVRRDDLVAALTIVVATIPAYDPAAAGKPGESGFADTKVWRLPAPSYADWFGASLPPENVPGSVNGFAVALIADTDALKAFGNDATAESVPERGPRRRLVWRRPVPAILVAYPCRADEPGACIRDRTPSAVAASDALPLSFPQLARREWLPVGSAGLFGSRTVKASFDGTGTPLTLSYGTDPGAAAIAGTIDSAGETATAIHAARLAALERRIAIEQALDTLDPPATAGN